MTNISLTRRHRVYRGVVLFAVAVSLVAAQAAQAGGGE